MKLRRSRKHARRTMRGGAFADDVNAVCDQIRRADIPTARSIRRQTARQFHPTKIGNEKGGPATSYLTSCLRAREERDVDWTKEHAAELARGELKPVDPPPFVWPPVGVQQNTGPTPDQQRAADAEAARARAREQIEREREAARAARADAAAAATAYPSFSRAYARESTRAARAPAAAPAYPTFDPAHARESTRAAPRAAPDEPMPGAPPRATGPFPPQPADGLPPDAPYVDVETAVNAKGVPPVFLLSRIAERGLRGYIFYKSIDGSVLYHILQVVPARRLIIVRVVLPGMAAGDYNAFLDEGAAPSSIGNIKMIDGSTLYLHRVASVIGGRKTKHKKRVSKKRQPRAPRVTRRARVFAY